MSDYDDIIGLSRPKSRRPPMPMEDRAAQFSPFAALTGHGAALKEVARVTEDRIALSDDDQRALNATLAQLRERLTELPSIQATYFLPDPVKAGGAYTTLTGQVRTIDNLNGHLVLVDGRTVPIADLVSVTLN